MPELVQRRFRVVQIPAPQGHPAQHQPQVDVVVSRWVQLQRPLDHLAGPVPLAQRKQRLGGIAGQHCAEGALQTHASGDIDTGQGLRDRGTITTGKG